MIELKGGKWRLELSNADIETVSDFRADALAPTENEGNLSLSTKTSNKYIAPGSVVELNAALSSFGDATAGDVAAGKTFTSAAGLLEVGTASNESGEGTNTLDSIIDRSIKTFSNDRYTMIGQHAFDGCRYLTEVDLPKVAKIDSYAFNGCRTLKTTLLPKCNIISDSAFYGCVALTEANFPRVTILGASAFYGCECLEVAKFPEVSDMGSSAFRECTKLTSVEVSAITLLPSNVFQGCASLQKIDLPNVSTINTYAFQGCASLQKIDLPNVSTINTYAFRNCAALDTIILRSKTRCTLSNINALIGTPFASGGKGGTAYVPAALVESYKTATGWKTLYGYGTCDFIAIEGSEYE